MELLRQTQADRNKERPRLGLKRQTETKKDREIEKDRVHRTRSGQAESKRSRQRKENDIYIGYTVMQGDRQGETETKSERGGHKDIINTKK